MASPTWPVYMLDVMKDVHPACWQRWGVNVGMPELSVVSVATDTPVCVSDCEGEGFNLRGG